MTDNPQVLGLLEEMLDSGKTPEEVCRDCPELLPEVRRRWLQFRLIDAQVRMLLPGIGTPSGADAITPASAGGLPQIPGYEVEAVLGHGGMGVVFRARHLRLNRVVALKMTLAGAYAGPHERDRFQREAEAVARLQHPNVVQIHDVGNAGGRPYFTMEFVDGGSLARKLSGAPQPAREAAALVATLAAAIHVAHAAGIVHRDLKPSNVLLAADGTPKVGDFGLARWLDGDAGLTGTGAAVGTPSYMAPEQARGRRAGVGPAADVYSLGAILYETLTGRPPFRAESAAETVQQVIAQDPVPPSRLNGKVPRDLETICLKCLLKEPGHRYVTAAALADDLSRFLRGEAIAARPEGRLARLARRVRRRPVLAGAVALATLSMIVLAGGGLWLLSDRAATARAAEDDLRDMARHLRDSSWPAAGAARDRAVGRLGDRAPAGLRNLADRGTRDLELAARLDAIHLKGVDGVGGGVAFAAYDREFAEAFRAAGLGTFDEDPEVVAGRIRESDIRGALVVALDAVFAREPRRSAWALDVARKADPVPSGWRVRARDPNVLRDPAALAELIATAPLDDPTATSLLAIETYVRDPRYAVADRVAILRRLQHAHPDDFWLNLRLGALLFQHRRYGEAVGYIQAALAVRPGSAVIRCCLGHALVEVGRLEEAVEQFRQAIELDSTDTDDVYHFNLARSLAGLNRHDDAVRHLRNAVRDHPNSALLHTELGSCLEFQGQGAEALGGLRKAVDLDPTRSDSHKTLRSHLLRRGRLDDAWSAWKAALASDPPGHGDRYGYAGLCLYLGKEDEYRRARGELLARFGASTDPYVAERTSRACLVLPAAGDELGQAVALVGRALAVDRSKYQGVYPYFLFVRGLAEFRQEQFDRAISTMRGDASRVPGPAPRVVLAMALHRTGQEAEARKTLAAAVPSHDWRADRARDQDGWIAHVLRREAERLILPDLPDFLAGKYRPRDNDERLALVGVCQSANRSVALARLYADAFTAAPHLAEDTVAWHRWHAARAAALAGCGRGEDAKGIEAAERQRWREQARRWLRADLAKWGKPATDAATRDRAKQWLVSWQVETDLAGLREPAELAKFDADERRDCLALWEEVTGAIKRNADAR